MLGRTLRMAFWVSHDHLGKLIVVNAACVAAAAPPITAAGSALASGDPVFMAAMGLPAAWLGLGIVLPVLAAGMAHMVKEFIETRDGSLRSWVAGIRIYAVRAAALGTIYLAAVVCLSVSAWFYAVRLGGEWAFAGYLLSALSLWALVLAGLSGLLAVAALVERRAGVWETLRLSVLLVIDNPGFSAGLAAAAGVWAVLAITPPMLVFFSVAPVVVLSVSGYEMLSRKYAARASGQPPAHNDGEDDYLNRGLRDFLFPWKG